MFDTTSPMGEAVFQIIAILKAMEVEVLRERIIHGLQAARARARGRNGGRKKGSYDKEKAELAAKLYKSMNYSNTEILKMTGIRSTSTLYRFLRLEGVYKEHNLENE